MYEVVRSNWVDQSGMEGMKHLNLARGANIKCVLLAKLHGAAVPA
jgi:hypothetical protein